MRSVVVVLPFLSLANNHHVTQITTYRIDMGDDANVAGGFGQCIGLGLRLGGQQPSWRLHIVPNDSTNTPHPSDPHTNESANAIDGGCREMCRT